MENFETYYPPKPTLIKKESQGHIAITVFSMVVFALTFSLIIDDYFLILSLIFVLLIHELGHFLLMKHFGYKKLKMLFIPFLGAMVQGEKSAYSQKESALMLMAGPLPGVLVGFLLINYGVGNEINFAIQLGVLFLLLNVLNLLPVDPLDGGQLLRTLFFGNHELIQLIFTFMSSLALIGIGFYLDAWLIMGFGFLLGFRVKSAYKLFHIRRELAADNIDYVSSYEQLSDKAFAKIKTILVEYTPVLKDIQEETEEERYNQLLANQVEGVLVRPMDKDAGWIFKILFLVIWFLAFYVTFYVLVSNDLNLLINAFQNR